LPRHQFLTCILRCSAMRCLWEPLQHQPCELPMALAAEQCGCEEGPSSTSEQSLSGQCGQRARFQRTEVLAHTTRWTRSSREASTLVCAPNTGPGRAQATDPQIPVAMSSQDIRVLAQRTYVLLTRIAVPVNRHECVPENKCPCRGVISVHDVHRRHRVPTRRLVVLPFSSAALRLS